MSMSPLNSLILGLGLFFLGLQLVGQNLRQLSGGGFRKLVKSATHTPFLAALLGLVAGALMQSATAVTFILVSMVGSGLIRTSAARIVVVWCNVGLTALAFLAAVNIHPFVACLVGGAGIFMGSVRAKPWNTIAGALLGVGMILFALGEMGTGAAPLKNETWFHTGLDAALGCPGLAFLCGIAAAAILQSNTGAAMLVITLAGAGAIPVSQAIPVIYGTNLGAIILRLFLSVGMKGDALRLVRMEDLFCAFSGVLMMGLFSLEAIGVPLVGPLLRDVTGGPSVRLAFVFLLSNLLPAIVLMPLLPTCSRLLKKLWPNDPAPQAGAPAFLTTQALADPASALDLLPKELGRLLAGVGVESSGRESPDPENHTSPDFISLAAAIENFCVRLASESPLDAGQSLRVQRLRAWLHTIRHIGEAVGEFADTFASLPTEDRKIADGLRGWLKNGIALSARATSTLDQEDVAKYHEASKPHGPPAEEIRVRFSADIEKCSTPSKPALAALGDDFDIAAWLIHRLSKLELKAGEG
ncbi:MAG: Na/Pi symporter [Terrimicrobiaceae bacterium]